ncbi:2-aminoethylphosphonate--pyruvate transaminase [Oceanidesulfovibrio marinus]|uniref:2-aminoethylphosphonate--pyruvate transaminase n=1 Tax=Oceanidesulfovibrio marinus TaxID=370038 RepID=A0ABX6NG37_9BACT|nr:2-aminoethylphosphonate--pyruvate transaminase [Oceanidesulfovibrio marinus]QJT09574.1 2-aminoethylphosphonate--pyruvate transaminase [Oceanidesulfovibrio marinus]
MDLNLMPDNPYVLLTPGPLSTSKSVRAAMFRDWCTWDAEYNDIVQAVRSRLVALATDTPGYTSVLMQGSGTFSVESCITTAVPDDGHLLVLANGHYGERMARIAERAGIQATMLDFGETDAVEPGVVREELANDPTISHVAVVHCETTTGMLNPVEAIGSVVKEAGRIYIVDAMSSFGGIPMDMAGIGADFLVSSANKCIQGVPGFGFILARRSEMETLEGRARSLSLDAYEQWKVMEDKGGKWRFTSPTHVVRAFAQALDELQAEGGVAARHARYSENQRLLVQGLRELGFRTLLPDVLQSPIITSFLYPETGAFEFGEFYSRLKAMGYVIYPGKVTGAATFRIGTIGEFGPQDVPGLLKAVAQALDEMQGEQTVGS